LVTFTPVASGSGLITYLWDFGSGATPATSTSSGAQSVAYSTVGPKTISLRICDVTTNCITEQKVGGINVGAGSVSQLAVDFSASQLGASTGQVIQLTSTVTGAVGTVSYSWHFDSGLSQGYLTAANPLIAYATAGNKTISLTVTDANGSVTKVKNSYLLITSFLFSVNPTILGGCLITGADATTSFSAAVSGGNGPPYTNYRWDFGDGTMSTEISPRHTYKKSGKYTVRVTVCDATSCGTGESVNCVTVPDVVDAFSFAAAFLVNNVEFGTTYSPVQVGLNTPVTFTDATRVNSTQYNYSWDFESHYNFGGTTESAVPANATTRGPHEVYFTSEGLKESTLIVQPKGPGNANRNSLRDGVRVVKGTGSGLLVSHQFSSIHSARCKNKLPYCQNRGNLLAKWSRLCWHCATK
jgi:PKD repeat protein